MNLYYLRQTFYQGVWKGPKYNSEPYFVGNNAQGWISKRVFQKNKARQILRKKNISYPLIRTRTYTYKYAHVRFLKNLACFFPLKHPFWDLPFCFITDDFSLMLTVNNNHIGATSENCAK